MVWYFLALNNVKQFTKNYYIYCLSKLNRMNTEMTGNTKRVHDREKFYHAEMSLLV